MKSRLIRLILGIVSLAAAIILERTENTGFMPLAFYIISFLIIGGDVIFRALKNIVRGNIFDENFLMSLATSGAFAIGENLEAVGVMLFYQIGEYFQDKAVDKSKESITSLMDIRPDYANLIKGSEIEKTAPDTVNTGDLILVKPGEKIPLDGIIIEGKSMLDTSALTGESVPRNAKVSDTVLSGCVNQTGVLKIKVTKSFGESTVSKIINLVENSAGKKAKTENFITSFARYYTPVVVMLAVLLAVLPPLFFGGVFSDWLRRSLVFLIISCPCALVLSIPMGFFAGIGRAAKSGILVKGGNYLEAFNNLEIAVFDKTGTLTKGVFKVTDILPAQGFSYSELLELAAAAESYSNHPIALSVMKAYRKEADKSKISDYTEISGCGISVKKDGKIILVGNDKLMVQNNIPFSAVYKNTGTIIYIAVDGIFAGCILISDEVKPDSKDAVFALKSKGVQKTIMLTGDNPEIAETIASELGIDEVYAGLLPQEKVEKVESFNAQKSKKGKLAFIGDGINDAPVLALADIGIAMGGLGSDAAIEAADVVLMTDELSKLPEVLDIAKFTKKIVWQNIIFALGIKTAFLALGAFGIAGMWEAIFADVGVALLAVLNAMRIFWRKKD
jgi:Cd2+/Zn2+-exporting ATPase